MNVFWTRVLLHNWDLFVCYLFSVLARRLGFYFPRFTAHCEIYSTWLVFGFTLKACTFEPYSHEARSHSKSIIWGMCTCMCMCVCVFGGGDPRGTHGGTSGKRTIPRGPLDVNLQCDECVWWFTLDQHVHTKDPFVWKLLHTALEKMDDVVIYCIASICSTFPACLTDTPGRSRCSAVFATF